MKLVIDIGNTLSKLCVFDGNDVLFQENFLHLDQGILNTCFTEYPEIKSSIVSSVTNHSPDIEQYINSKVPVLMLDANTKLPFKNNYATPATLGKDRIAAVAGALSKFPERNVLIVDAGTCITFDLIDRDQQYHGGAISPGISMRFKSLHTFTGKLPLIEFERNHDIELIGNTTKASILSGVQKAVLFEIDGTINEYKNRFSNLQTVVTGGDFNYLYKYLKNNIFAAQNLVLIGLKKILDYNEGS